MYFKYTLPVLVLHGLVAYAGTGHAKDLDLAYIIVLVIFALIIGIWNGIDYIGKNRGMIKQRLNNLKEKLIEFLFSARRDFSDRYDIIDFFLHSRQMP